jgi:hypothetical protein
VPEERERKEGGEGRRKKELARFRRELREGKGKGKEERDFYRQDRRGRRTLPPPSLIRIHPPSPSPLPSPPKKNTPLRTCKHDQSISSRRKEEENKRSQTTNLKLKCY